MQAIEQAIEPSGTAKQWGNASSSTLSSVATAMRVLRSFTAAHREWGVSDLSRHLGIGKSTAHRLLATMVEERVLEQDGRSGRYRLGLAVLDLAAAVPTQFGLHEAVMSPMSDLRNHSGETTHVAVLDGRQVVYVERLDSPHTLRMFLEIGRRNHAHSTGTGKVLLAYLPPGRLEALLAGWELARLTPHTITDHRTLRNELEMIRSRGWAENRHESELGVVSFGAPLRSATGEVIAALSVAGPTDRMDLNAPTMVQALLETAGLVSRRLGWGGLG